MQLRPAWHKGMRFVFNFVGTQRVRCPSTSKKSGTGISFAEAEQAFFDPKRIIALDLGHSTIHETRYFCFGKVGDGILTVRFTYRENRIRILGAGYWRKGKKAYEDEN